MYYILDRKITSVQNYFSYIMMLIIGFKFNITLGIVLADPANIILTYKLCLMNT